MGSFTQLTYHIVFATKYRKRTITADIRQRMYEYIGGTLRSSKSDLLEIGGVEDHVHILANISATMAVSDVVRSLKSCSSKWVNELPGKRQEFHWQKGYAAFTVSYSQVDLVRAYIQDQPAHHQVKTFAEEYVEFLQRHGIEFQMKHLFEQEHHG